MKIKLLCLFLIFSIINSQSLEVRSENPDTISPTLSENLEINNIKIDYKLSNIDSPLKDIIWCGDSVSDNIVLVLSERGSIYRSTDKGISWLKLNEMFHKSAYLELEKDQQVGIVSQILLSPVDKNLILFLGNSVINWKSENCGGTIVAMNQGRQVNEFMFHPTERNWMLAAAWTLCEDFDAGEPCQIYKELFVTTDLGENWKTLEDYVVQFSWGVVDKDFLKQVPKERVILAHDPNGKGHQNYTGWSKKVQVSYSDNLKNFKTLMQKGNRFLLTKNYFFVAQVISEASQTVSLKIANPNAKQYYFKNVELPSQTFQEKSYTILDTSEHQINHEGLEAKYGNIYASDGTGTKYSLSLIHNSRNNEGIYGIYVANYYDNRLIEKYKANKRKEINTENKNNLNKKNYEIEHYKKTVISFDKGGIWQPIKPPALDSRNQPIKCLEEDCSLHLHLVTNANFAGFYSSEKAVGLLLATGNVGEHLSQRTDELNTYFSRDGGVSWAEIMKGSFIYEIGDHGGILILANDNIQTDTVYYSWNEGLSWQSLRFTQKKIHITNIINEPTNTATNFIIYGVDEASNQGILVSLDFGEIHKNYCKGINNPSSPQSDYEYWSPQSQFLSKCILGKKSVFVRKKQASKCFNGENFEKKLLTEICKCTEEDWECDVGYVRDKDGPCRPVNPTDTKDKAIENCTNFYFVSSGYRKVPGDLCEGGVFHEPTKIPCPQKFEASQPSSKLNNLLAGVMIIIIIVLIFLKKDILIENVKTIVWYAQQLLSKKENKNINKYKRFEEMEANVDFSNLVFDENEDHQDNAMIDEEKA